MRALPLSVLLFSLFACSDAPSDGSVLPDAPPPDSAPPDTGTDDSATDSGPVDPDSGDPSDSGADSGQDTGDPQPAMPPAVMLFIGDGMGFAHVQGGGMYAHGAAGSLVMETLPYRGRLQTASLSGLTDSAAAATAMASGQKTWNDVLGLDRDGRAVESLIEQARARGMSVGVVTTDALTGATPSAFVVHVEDRGDAPSIVEGYLAAPPDIALGGGRGDFGEVPDDVQLVTSGAELASAEPDGRPLLGLFADRTFDYVAEGYPADTPSLADMTAAALDWLDDDPEGFFLVVEGARIDHASHGNLGDNVFHEVAALDDAVAAGLAWAGTREATMLVTADHECGGLSVEGAATAGTVPTNTWRWTRHTNADVPVFGSGPLASAIDGQRVHNLWVHAVLSAAIDDATSITAPSVPTLVDGATGDLGAAVATQAWETSFGAGFNQLDALYVTSDADGLLVGIDGVTERDANGVLLFVDLDRGRGTGLGADVTAADLAGVLDGVITGTADRLDVSVDGVGFDVVVGTLGAMTVEEGYFSEEGGLRGVCGEWGDPADFHWLAAAINQDDGNVSYDGTAAPDAAATGLTENGVELRLRWETVFPDGLPAHGVEVAVWALLVNADGTWISNQGLPALSSADEPGAGTVTASRVAVLSVDAFGLPLGSATVTP
jgi:alkaline phosphatase